jgi:hypothetical protein
MLLLRPTKKVMNIGRIIPDIIDDEVTESGPLNEWYVDIVGLGKPGKNALLFVHRTTYVTVIVPGNSLENSVPVFKERFQKILKRYEADDNLLKSIYSSLDPVIFAKTNDRKPLGVINQVKLEINTLFKSRFDVLTFADWDWLEINYQTYPHKPYEGKRWDYTTPEEGLRKVIAGIY